MLEKKNYFSGTIEIMWIKKKSQYAIANFLLIAVEIYFKIFGNQVPAIISI